MIPAVTFLTGWAITIAVAAAGIELAVWSFRKRGSTIALVSINVPIALGALLALSGCMGDSTGSKIREGVAFEYRGDRTGRYAAADEPGGPTPERIYAGAVLSRYSSGEDAAIVLSRHMNADGNYTGADFVVAFKKGSYTCGVERDNSCSMFVRFGRSGSGVDVDSDVTYISVGGRVEVTSITTDRMRGRFSFTLHRQNSPAPDLDSNRVLRVVSGTFDVPIRPRPALWTQGE